MKLETLINNKNFEKIEEISHDDLKPFLRREITGNQGWRLIAKMYQGIGLLLIGFALIKAFAPFMRSRETFMLEGMGWGVLFSFTALVIIHELLHCFAYLLVGARKLSFGVNLRKFMFYVQADMQVLNYKQFMIVALAPAVVVGLVSLAGAVFYYGQPLYYFFMVIFGLHGLFCGGDFGLLCFFENRKEDEIYTFDVKKEGKTYFYKKI
ncbi:MAG: DUF3267 domain-containing protein [Paludibacteraceae bacterium]